MYQDNLRAKRRAYELLKQYIDIYKSADGYGFNKSDLSYFVNLFNKTKRYLENEKINDMNRYQKMALFSIRNGLKVPSRNSK